jgi:prepilin-type N-terminal cleavage/methylation domain-containing protein
MRTAPERPGRPAFTLVELLVVIGIILVLLVIGAAFLPGLQGNQKVQTGVDRLSQWLLIAKQRAKHDGLPTGLRFLPAGASVYNTFQYVQQPDFLFGDPAVGNGCFTVPNTPLTNPLTYGPKQQVLFPPNTDFVGGDPNNPLVQAGDYLELFGGGALYQIAGVTTAVNPVDTKTYVALQLSANYTGATVPTATTNWRIIRQPRPVVGEDVLTLPQDVVVDISNMPPPAGSTTTTTWSQNVPTRTTGGVTYYEILFSPAGGVMGQVASSGKIVLWMRDVNVPSPVQGDAPSMQGNPTLVSVQVRTGFIGSYPVVPNTVTTQYPAQFYTAALQGRSGF